MDFRKLSNLLTLIGSIISIIAFAWWYIEMTRYGKPTASNWGCLINPNSCSWADDYSPVLLYLGLVPLIAGIVIKKSMKKDS
ncbi:MAG: hypothetical protein HWE30_00950 [Methylocystaceae bacterium]|nr:hypothetical protein [Methylocystaceae bacterium]